VPGEYIPAGQITHYYHIGKTHWWPGGHSVSEADPIESTPMAPFATATIPSKDKNELEASFCQVNYFA